MTSPNHTMTQQTRSGSFRRLKLIFKNVSETSHNNSTADDITAQLKEYHLEKRQFNSNNYKKYHNDTTKVIRPVLKRSNRKKLLRFSN